MNVQPHDGVFVAGICMLVGGVFSSLYYFRVLDHFAFLGGLGLGIIGVWAMLQDKERKKNAKRKNSSE